MDLLFLDCLHFNDLRKLSHRIRFAFSLRSSDRLHVAYYAAF